MSVPSTLDLSRLENRLKQIYPQRASEAFELLQPIITKHAGKHAKTDAGLSERDVVLITYGDQVHSAAANPLQTLLRFLTENGLHQLINTVHFLPCFPYSSDDGFSVIDYLKIDPNLGSWDDIAAYREHFSLMLDFVVNHVSQESEWFQAYLRGDSPFDRFFIEADPAEDLSQVTRPRSLPLLSEFETSAGPRHLWTTFSRDQLDLNYAEPIVLATMVDIWMEYVSRGARIIRLDAIAYLWKQVGTNCIHLEETHLIVKLFRDVVDLIAPHVLVLTETNVPHEENVSYFGDGDEAHMVYQFSLPPLLLDAFLNENAIPLKQWLAELPCPPAGATYFNFTASHDGVGVRPLEGRVDRQRLDSLVDRIKARNGIVSTRRQADGSDSPYELNISYVDALGTESSDTAQHAKRFLTTQAIMLSLQGMPAIYFHSLVGTQNDLAGVEQSGIPRRINRRKFEQQALTSELQNDSLQAQIFAGMQKLLRIRIQQPAFHPNGAQQYVESGSDHVLTFLRTAANGQAILVAANFGDQPEVISLPADFTDSTDLLGSASAVTNPLSLEPAQIVWLERTKTDA